jgi:signal transduction histidine kinase
LDDQGNFAEVLSSGLDNTERRQAEEKLRALSQRIANAQEDERRRIARELHDLMGQSLTALSINLTAARNKILDATPSVVQRLDSCLNLIEEMGRQVENLMTELHPPILDDYGLVSALRWQAERFKDLTGLKTRVVCSCEPERLGHEVELGLFRVIQEGLNNIVKHSGASSARIEVKRRAKGLILSVSDNGKGFKPGEAVHQDERHHWGLAIMTERVRTIGGTLRVESTPGEGTLLTVELTLPLPTGNTP